MNKSVLMWLNYLAACLINTLGGSESSQYAAQNQSNNRPTENKPIFSPSHNKANQSSISTSFHVYVTMRKLQFTILVSHSLCSTVHYNTFP